MVGLLLWGTTAVWADEVPYRHFTTFDGLPSESVTALAQTPEGLLWVGTKDGLALYDGRSFRTIAFPDSVATPKVKSLRVGPDGAVWVGLHYGAVAKVSPRGISRYIELGQSAATLSRILVRRGTMHFVTTRAVWRLSSGAARPSRIPFRYQTQPPSEANGAPPNVGVGAWDADIGPNGDIWILDGRLGPGRFHSNGTVAFVGGNVVRQGRFWNDLRFAKSGEGFVTQGRHLYRFQPAERTLEVVIDTLDSTGTNLYLQNGTVYLLQRKQVVRYNPATGQTLDALGVEKGLSGETPTCIWHSQEDALWVGMENGLLHFVAPEVRHVEIIEGHSLRYVTRFLKSGSYLWVASWGKGLLQLRPERQHVTPGGHNRWVPLRSRDENLHALPASDGSWYRWRPTDGWEQWATAPNAVRGFVDSGGIGVFWHDDGIYRHVPTSREAATPLATWPTNERDRYMLALAPNGDPLLRTGGHLVRLHPTKGTVLDTLASFPHSAGASGVHMVADPAGRIWGAFESGGLLRVDPKEGNPRLLLQNQSVENVRASGDSLVLASTQNGVYLIEARSGTVHRHLTQADGLKSSTASGAYLTPDTLYVSHPNGLSLLPVDRVFRQEGSPPALLTDLEVNLDNRSLRASSGLTASERTIGFSYTAPELIHSGRVRYEVRLPPRNTEWRPTPHDFVRYSDLEPGTYRFEVRARLDNAPPGPAATYTFTIPPHFYETWWFWGLVGLACLGIGWAVYRWRTRRLRQRREVLEATVEAQTEQLRERAEALEEEKRKNEKQAERLAELDEAKNQFFAHISHEFRTPLSLILCPLRRALRRGTELSTEQKQRLVGNAQRLRRLVDQLLDLSTAETGQMELNLQPGDLVTQVTRTVENFRMKAEEEGIALESHVAEDRLDVCFDPEKIEKVVSNLVDNALKFTPEDGAVTVSIDTANPVEPLDRPDGKESVDKAIRIEVRDTGPGIDADNKEQVFDRFQKVNDARTAEDSGIGLGLALTKELVELHGGRIAVESTPGEGTTFRVWLPLMPVRVSEASSTAQIASAANDTSDGRGEPLQHPEEDSRVIYCKSSGDDAGRPDSADESTETILVVEDNDEMRAYLREELSTHWQILEASDANEGWKAVQKHAPDLLLSDVLMPGPDGYELCRKVKNNPNLQVIPVILLTARVETEEVIKGLDCGADDYVPKPFDVEELRQRIENHLTARKRARDRYQKEVHLGSLDQTVDVEHVSFLETVTEVVEAHLGDPDFSVDQLAEAAALSRRQLTRRMKKTVNQTPAAFIRTRRLERAQQLLEGDAETVAEVAYAVGFRSPSAFSKAFRENVGETPSSYAEQ